MDQADDQYLDPATTERVLTALGEIQNGTAKGTPIEERIAELERDPERKKRLDAARARLQALKVNGSLAHLVRTQDLVLTERGLKVVDPVEGDA